MSANTIALGRTTAASGIGAVPKPRSGVVQLPRSDGERLGDSTRSCDYAVAVSHLHVERGGRPVLVDVGLHVGWGEVLAIRGPSGVGKSSLLGVLCGLIRPKAGSVRVLGYELATLNDRLRSALRLGSFGLVFQGHELLPELSVIENVTLPLRLGSRPQRTADYQRLVEPILAKLGIADLAERQLHEISGGQLQRAAVARAVVHRPPVILADEPTESLDAVAAAAAMQLLIELAREQNSSVVVVTHDSAVAAAADRELVLEFSAPPSLAAETIVA